jgi:hypothetical protein
LCGGRELWIVDRYNPALNPPRRYRATPVLSVFLFGGNLRIKPPIRGGELVPSNL